MDNSLLPEWEIDLKTWLNNDLLYSEGESQLLQLWVLGD